MLAELHEDLRTHLDLPFAFFGHSMGAIIAYEMARLLLQEGTSPMWMFLSGRGAPKFAHDKPLRHTLPNEQFINKVQELEGIPQQILRFPGMMDLIVPILRADFELCENYRYREGPLLTCPISALGGTSDPEVTRDQLLGWKNQTRGFFHLRLFPGGHFFLQEVEAQVVHAVAQDLLHFVSAGWRPSHGLYTTRLR
jgi:medium-chain acyl-[acyl-carrier-protein] hydrolase